MTREKITESLTHKSSALDESGIWLTGLWMFTVFKISLFWVLVAYACGNKILVSLLKQQLQERTVHKSQNEILAIFSYPP